MRRFACAATLVAVAGLVACSGGGKPGKPSAVALPASAFDVKPLDEGQRVQVASLRLLDEFQSPPPVPVADTPDNAVKSWWQAIDAREKVSLLLCMTHRGVVNPWHTSHGGSAATGEFTSRYARGSEECALDRYRRQIAEVKSESETRAVVFTTVWHDKSIPSSAEKDDAESAKKGTKFKYVLEKSAGKWLMSDILRFEEKSIAHSERWVRTYEDKSNPPYFTGTVYYQ